jgi:uncharacterized protein (TIGR03118 family)
MKSITKVFLQAMVIFGCAFAVGSVARAGDAATQSAYVQTNLTSNLMGAAANRDPNLQNAWGVAFVPGGAFWISDNNSGLSSFYRGNGTLISSVTIPLPPEPRADIGTLAAPTGMVWNPTSGFAVPGTAPAIPALFIFDSEDGTISAWAPGLNPSNQAVLAVDNSQAGPAPGCPGVNCQGAVYKGLAFGTNIHGNFLFATNFRAGTIDVFDKTFTQTTLDGSFSDPALPAGFAPFGIRNIDGDLFVTYAKQNAQKHDDVPGRGNGFVDIFDTDGHLIRRFVSRTHLNSPWGIEQATSNFGSFSGDILIGNFGDGTISVFDPKSGGFKGKLMNTSGIPISIDGLWTLNNGGGSLSSPDTLYFTAGPNNETNGLFGTIAPVSTGVAAD